MGEYRKKMKILALVLASSQAFSVFDVGTVCTEGGTECGQNEVCVELKCACLPGYIPEADGGKTCDKIAEACSEELKCASDAVCAEGKCDCLTVEGCHDGAETPALVDGACDAFCNVIPVVETTTAAVVDTTTAANITSAPPSDGA